MIKTSEDTFEWGCGHVGPAACQTCFNNRLKEKTSEHMRYVGVLSLLTQCSVYVTEEIRECIETAMIDAVTHSDGTLKWKRILDRIQLDINN